MRDCVTLTRPWRREYSRLARHAEVGRLPSPTNEFNVVNSMLDMKGPLKGKGGALAQWEREARMRLRDSHDAMAQLSAQTRLHERRWSLNLYRARGGVQLRWRMTDGRHTVWARIAPLLRSLAPALRQWYGEVDDCAQVLNHREQAIRHELKTVLRLRSRDPPRTEGRSNSARAPVN
jgi:hypothetical protein